MLKTLFRFLALTTAIAALGTALVMGAANAAVPTGHVIGHAAHQIHQPS